MSQKRLLDSFALLAYLNKESGYEKVKRHLVIAQESQGVIMNEINIGETYYILSRTRGEQNADYFIETVLEGLPILIVTNHFDTVIDAARIKAAHPLSYADCFAVATAMQEDAVILTGDPEFKNVTHLVEIEWMS